MRSLIGQKETNPEDARKVCLIFTSGPYPNSSPIMASMACLWSSLGNRCPLIGIDLSENMVRKAEKKNIYDELYVDDIIDRLDSLETKFDLFIASDVFIYIGNLLPLFQCVKKHSKKNTLFVFSTEHTDCNDYILLNTHRFAHSKDYVLSVATESGFQLEYFTQSNLRKERKNWIIGGIYALRSV